MRYKFYVAGRSEKLNGWSWDNILLSQADVDKCITTTPVSRSIVIDHERNSSCATPAIVVSSKTGELRSDTIILGRNTLPWRESHYTIIIVDETHWLFNLDLILKYKGEPPISQSKPGVYLDHDNTIKVYPYYRK